MYTVTYAYSPSLMRTPLPEPWEFRVRACVSLYVPKLLRVRHFVVVVAIICIFEKLLLFRGSFGKGGGAAFSGLIKVAQEVSLRWERDTY